MRMPRKAGQNLKDSLRGNCNKCFWQLWSLLQKRWNQKSQRTFNNGSEPSREFPDRKRLRSQQKRISKVLDYAPCKTKNPMDRCNLLQKDGVNVMWGESALLANPKEGRSNKRKINMHTVQGHVNLDTSARVHETGWTSNRFVKINLDSTYLQNLKTSIPIVTNTTQWPHHDIHALDSIA